MPLPLHVEHLLPTEDSVKTGLNMYNRMPGLHQVYFRGEMSTMFEKRENQMFGAKTERKVNKKRKCFCL